MSYKGRTIGGLYDSPTGRLPRPWPEIWRDKPDAKAGPQPAFLGADFGEIEARAVAAIHAGTLTEFGSIANDAIERLVNPAPYYNLSMCRHKLTVVQLAIAAVEGGYRPVECFNHAVDGGIVFG